MIDHLRTQLVEGHIQREEHDRHWNRDWHPSWSDPVGGLAASRTSVEALPETVWNPLGVSGFTQFQVGSCFRSLVLGIGADISETTGYWRRDGNSSTQQIWNHHARHHADPFTDSQKNLASLFKAPLVGLMKKRFQISTFPRTLWTSHHCLGSCQELRCYNSIQPIVCSLSLQHRHHLAARDFSFGVVETAGSPQAVAWLLIS